MYKTGYIYGLIGIANRTKVYLVEKTGSHIDFKLKYKKCGNLHNCTRKVGQSANRINRIGLQKRELYLNEISEKAINYFMINNKYIVEDVIIFGPEQLKKKELASTYLMQQYLLNSFFVSTEDINDNTVERVFKDYLNRGNINKHPIISYLQELIQKGNDESLIVGFDDVKKEYSNYELKYLTPNDQDLFEKYKGKDKDTGCKTIYTRKLYDFGKIIGIK